MIHKEIDEFKYLINNSKNDMLEVEVKDSGEGIKNEDHKILYKLFGYLYTTQELNIRGIGLGLYISIWKSNIM